MDIKETDNAISTTYLITGIILAVLFAPFALQRVLIPSLGRLKTIFITDIVIAVCAIINAIAVFTFSSNLIKVFSVLTVIATLVLFVITIIDVAKMYKMSRVKL